MYKTHKDAQKMNKEKYEQFVRWQEHKMQDLGFKLDGPKAFVSLNRVVEVNYDSGNNCYYKVYSEENDLVPM